MNIPTYIPTTHGQALFTGIHLEEGEAQGNPHAVASPMFLSRRIKLKLVERGTSLAVLWLGLHTSNAGVTGSIPGRGTKISHAARCGQNK